MLQENERRNVKLPQFHPIKHSVATILNIQQKHTSMFSSQLENFLGSMQLAINQSQRKQLIVHSGKKKKLHLKGENILNTYE